MAKKAQTVDTTKLDRTEREIEKLYGADIYLDANSVLAKEKVTIPVSPAIDIALNGGIPEGSWVIFSGPEKCGKTTTALHFAANCQLPEYGGRTVYYLDIEGRLKRMNLLGVPHLNVDKLKIIRSKQGKILTAEDYLGITERIIHNEINAVLIIDSFSALCTASEMAAELNEQQRGDSQRLQAKFIRRTSNVVPVNNTIVIGITHRMANLSGFGASSIEKSAGAVKYQGDVKLEANKIVPWKTGEKIVGQIVTWKARFTALGAPGGEAQSYIRYGQSIDEVSEIILMGAQIGVIEKPETSAWYTFQIDGNEVKTCGLEKTISHLKANPDHMKALRHQILEAIS